MQIYKFLYNTVVFVALPLIYADLNMKILYYCNENLMRILTANNRNYKHYKLKNKTSRHITVMRIWGAMFLIVMIFFFFFKEERNGPTSLHSLVGAMSCPFI